MFEFLNPLREMTTLSVCVRMLIAMALGAVIGLEFALDRTTWNKLLIYAAMMIVVAIPAVLGMILLKTNGEENIAE